MTQKKTHSGAKTVVSGQNIDSLLEAIQKDTIDNLVWHENRVHHLLSKEAMNYTNYLVHTSKFYNIHRVSISAQFWIVNEMVNQVGVVFVEKGYAYEPLNVSSIYTDLSSFPSTTESPDQKKEPMMSSSLRDDMSFDKQRLEDLICTQNFKCMTKREKTCLLAKHKTIKTFTGTPFDMSKSMII